MYRRLLIAVIVLFSTTAFAQSFHDFGFSRSQNIAVRSQNEQLFSFPWAGGINSVKAAPFDLDFDGIEDLILFEKHGNRLLPFLNLGFPDSVAYLFAPQYSHFFPEVHNWVVLRDYNGDGKPDIFTYGLAGITVYKNVSSENEIRFQLITEQIQSYYYNGYTNLYTSPDDYLAIKDIDGDGDLDILNFWILGKYVHYHRNYSIEIFGDAEHLDFRLEDECWGHFEEAGESNAVILNSSCGQKDEPTRHVGSTLLVHDFDDDGLEDLLLGDIDYPNLALLRNGGTPQEALMVSVDTLFPSPSQPVWLYSMPVVSFADVDNNGRDEMLVSPSDPSLTKSKDHHSLWLYKRDEVSGLYHKICEDFLQNQMVDVGSGAVPVLYDWNGDGLTDLFVANYGSYDSSKLVNGFLTSYYASSISYYKNIGNQYNPSFRLVTEDFGNLKRYGYQALCPTFGDVDGDGRTDLLCGSSDGTLLFFRNQGDTLPDFAPPAPNYAGIDVGDFSTPQLFDLDRDGRLDLIVGNRRGRIAYYHNMAPSGSSDFQCVTDTLGGVDVRDDDVSFFGYCVPRFFRNSQNETVLFCGNEQGTVVYYDLIDNNLSGTFRKKESALNETVGEGLYPISDGIRSAPAVADLDGDGYPDLLVGNYAGGLSLFMGTVPPPLAIDESRLPVPSLTVFPNPTAGCCTIALGEPARYNIAVYDLSGRQLSRMETAGSSIFSLDLTGYPDGLYIGRCESAMGVRYFKVVKQ